MKRSDVLISPAALCSFTVPDPFVGHQYSRHKMFYGGSVYSFKEITTHIVSSKTGKPLQSIKKINETLKVPDPDSSVSHTQKYFTIKQSPAFVSGLTGSISCAAYGNDSMFYNLQTLYKNINQSSHANASIAWTPLTQGKPNNVIFFVRSSMNPAFLDKLINIKGIFKNTKHRTSLLRFINLYVRIPWILLDPSEEAEAYARKVKPALKIYTRRLSNTTDIYIGFKFPITALVTPFLHWWVSVMIREAFSIWVAQFKSQISPMIPDGFENDLLNTVKGLNLTKIINTHDWNKAKQIWSKLHLVFNQYCAHNQSSCAWSSTNITSNHEARELLSLPQLLEGFATLGGLTTLEVPGSYQIIGKLLARKYESLQDFYHTLAVSAWSLKSSVSIEPHAKTALGLQGWLRATSNNSFRNLKPNRIVFRMPASAQQLNTKLIKPFENLTAHEARARNQKNVPR